MNFTERSTQITYLAQINPRKTTESIKNEGARSWWKAKVIFKHYLPHDRRCWRQTSKVTHGLHFTIMLFLIVTLIVEKDVNFRNQGALWLWWNRLYNLIIWPCETDDDNGWYIFWYYPCNLENTLRRNKNSNVVVRSVHVVQKSVPDPDLEIRGEGWGGVGGKRAVGHPDP